jgi:mono/diheme cytochrome c family protein
MRKQLAIFGGAALLVATLASAQSGHRSVWNGVYSPPQAATGQSEFRANCSSCHGADLGGRSAPALTGDLFMDHWREDNVGSLYHFIKSSMPPRAEGLLNEGQALSIVSYILQSNGFPSGSKDLSADAVGGIQIEGPNGPEPIPDRALVQIVGCLAKGDTDDSWTMSQASEPVRTRNTGKSSPEEIKVAQAKPLGTLAFSLQNLAMAGILSPDDKIGNKMVARGALLRRDDGNRISITALESVAAKCE